MSWKGRGNLGHNQNRGWFNRFRNKSNKSNSSKNGKRSSKQEMKLTLYYVGKQQEETFEKIKDYLLLQIQ